MTWIELEYSQTAVRKAGKKLISDELSDADFESFMDVLDNWRASHAYPLQIMLKYFRDKALGIDKNALVVRRLKRTPSILLKLRREQGMQLQRMEDIGGCRVVVSSKARVYQVRDEIISGRTRNKLVRERDYIKSPKESGYRSYHLVYEYNGQKEVYRGHKIELQIRSLIQHSWATAVEVVGAFTKQSLKASEGEEEWIKFFKLASLAFSDMENRKLQYNALDDERIELIESIQSLRVINKLQAFAVSTEYIGKNSGFYFLLVLDIKSTTIKVRKYAKNELEIAAKDYQDFEASCVDNPDMDVVLVSATSINALKKAYPNYFADTSQFVKNVKKIVDTQESLI